MKTLRLRLVVVAVVLVMAVPAWAGTADRENGGLLGLLDFVVQRIEALLGIGEEPSPSVVYEADGVTTYSGGCFDPWGKPKPCP